MKPGARGKIVAGPFTIADTAKVIEDLGEKLKVELTIEGQDYRATVPLAELELDRETSEDPTPHIWDAIQQEITARVDAFDVPKWWAMRERRTYTDEELVVLLEHSLEMREAKIADDLAVAERDFRAKYDPLSFEERRALWKSERDQWSHAPLRRQPDALRALAEKTAHEKRRRDHPLGQPDPRTTPIATAPEIEAEIDRDPSDPKPYLVYADLLQAKGDPRGELIALQAGGDRPDLLTAQNRLLSKHGPYFLGPLYDHPINFGLDWRYGFIEIAELAASDATPSELLDTLLTLPSARFLRSLWIQQANDVEGAIEALLRHRPRHLRSLRIGSDDDPENDNGRDFGPVDLSALLSAFPELEELAIRAEAAELPELELPSLKVLRLETTVLSHENLFAFGARAWPQLEALTFWVGASSAGASIRAEELMPLLTGDSMPRLRSLAIQNAEIADDLCAMILAAPILPRLEALDLSMGTMSDEGAETLGFGAKLLAKLRLLDVRRSYLTTRACKRLAKLKPVVLDRPQREPDEDWEPEFPARRVLIDDDLPL